MRKALLLAMSLTHVVSSVWPPPIAPVWPTQYKAEVHGVSLNLNISAETGHWYYDWPRNMYRADYVNHYIDGSTRRDTQLWNATEDKFYIFQNNFSKCFYFPVGNISVLRPDWAVQCKCTSYVNRTTVNGHIADLYQSNGGGSNDFSLYMDPITNLQLGIVSGDGISNYFDKVTVGDPGEAPFELDTSMCAGAGAEELQLVRTRSFYAHLAAQY